jgi:acetolactate synthase-1/2/3 large subunit
VVASAAELLGGLAERLGVLRLPRRDGSYGVVRQVLPQSRQPDRIAAHAAVTELQSLMPADTIYTVDSGEHFVAATHFLEIAHPDSYVVMTGLGSMGQSIGAAIGAALAHPARTVAAICGDGCFAMNAFEIATAVAERIPIRVFVFNDERMGMVEKGHQTVYGRHPSYGTKPLDVCAIASGLGAETLRVDSLGALRDAHELLRDARGPVVIDVGIDHEIVVTQKDRIARLIPQVKPRPQPTLLN